jgi:CspA family cold shock protein
VKWFNDDRGYGIIAPEDRSKECFVHRSAIQEGVSLSDRDRLEFDVVQEGKGPAARDVTKVSD